MENIVETISQEVISRCQQYKVKTGDDKWVHIENVFQYALVLAEMYNADKEIVALGALLHDIASPSEHGEPAEHHIFGAEIAETLLSELNYPPNRIEWVKNCVLNHRGSKARPKNTIEEECVADADALSHLACMPSLFHWAYSSLNLSSEDGKAYVKKKLQNDYYKLSERTKVLVKEKYDIVMDVIFSDNLFNLNNC